MHILQPDVDQNLVAAMPERRQAVSKYLNEQERSTLARLLVRDVDRYSFQLHCKNESCASLSGAENGDDRPVGGNGDGTESACEFRLVTCPNPGCSAEFSYKRRSEHDDACGFKLLPCPSGCGTEIPRNKVHAHVRDKCILRDAECPLSTVGCTAVVQAQDVALHLNEHADQHFVLVVNRMMEYQSMFKKLNARINLLEEKNARLERELHRKTAELSSKNEAHAISNEVKKLTKRLGTLEGTCRTEFKKVEQERRSHQK